MKLSILIVVTVNVILLFCSASYASGDCDAKYKQYINELKKTNKIVDQQKKKYIAMLEQAYKLCKQDKMAEASQVMDELKDQFFQDAVLADHTFWSH